MPASIDNPENIPHHSYQQLLMYTPYKGRHLLQLVWSYMSHQTSPDNHPHLKQNNAMVHSSDHNRWTCRMQVGQVGSIHQIL